MGHSFIARGGWWVIGQNVLLLTVLALGLVFKGQWQSTAGVIAGATLFISGGILGLLGVRALGKNLTALPRPREGAAFVRSGVYGVVRHPLYSSVILVSFGWGLLWASGPSLVAAALLAILLYAKASCEEKWLRDKFPEYAGYQQRVRRLLPWLW